MSDSSLFPQDDSASVAPPRWYARVVVERGIDRGVGPDGLTYACPDSGPEPKVGDRVMVPLGRSGKQTGGVVIEVGDAGLLGDLKPGRVKAVSSFTGARIPEELVKLAGWMATYYVCPLGMVMSALMPAAVKRAEGTRVVEFVRYSDLGRALRLSTDEEPLRKLGRAARATWLRLASPDAPRFPAPLKAVLGAMEIKSPRGVRDLASAGLLECFEERTLTAGPLRLAGAAPLPAPTPTAEQARVIDGMGATLDGFRVHVLRGVTGAGKTEVYLRLIERVLEAGGSAIVLVPEISLTPQTSARFVGRFGAERVAVLHSGLTGAQRNKEWSRTAGGGARVVVGARSAVFAPVTSLGLIVVDEEHDPSYKQDQLPRYSARDVAVKRGHLEGIPVVLGSATPSLESWSNAVHGRYSLWELTSRAGGGSLPHVEVVDLREERRMRASMPDGEPGRLHQLGPTLEKAIDGTLRDNGQVILFLNRRGFAHYIACPDPKCGFIVSCDQCDANLVLHRGSHFPVGELVRCHHCLSESLVPLCCPTCRKKLNPFGGGTQRVEQEICRKFGAYGIEEGTTLLRLDSDTMRTATDYFDALERFGRGDARVLLGTQMIAKGLDFAGVRLVG
ncbi:MAG: replication restart helicase PriA, partial [Phycisphaerales bacterium]